MKGILNYTVWGVPSGIVDERGKGIGRDSLGFQPTAGQRSNQLNYVPTTKTNDLR